MNDAFFELHKDLPREGPGHPDDLRWVLEHIDLKDDARICDAGCGPGADVDTFLEERPSAHVTAVDAHKPFINALLARLGPDPRVMAYAGDMLKLKGPFDLIWCAGAIYFPGIEKALIAWRPSLAKGSGAVAFSASCFFPDTPSDAARAFWGGDRAWTQAEIGEEAARAGFKITATRRLEDAAWEAYYGPQEARIAQLRPGANEDLAAVLDAGLAEAAAWRAVKQETGYLLVIAEPA